MILNLNITMLQEMGDTAYFRLPDLGLRLPKGLRGRPVKSAAKLARMAMYSLAVLKAADEDVLAARNEVAMAKSAKSDGDRNYHLERCKVLSLQAKRRQEYSGARLEAISCAEAL